MNSLDGRYAQRIVAVQRFIEDHLDENLALDRLAELAGYSPCHFHRVFHGVVGESTADYVRRLRMERAAQSLRYRRRSVLEIALDAGYGSHEAFTRAFTRTFGVTPSEYQSLEHHPPAIKEQLMHAVPYQPDAVRIVPMPARRFAAIRVVGQYSNATLGPAFGRISQWAASRGLLGPQTVSLGVYYDDPEVTEPDRQRCDAGVTVPEGTEGDGEVRIQTLPAGVCAVLRHQGHYDTLETAYRWLYAVWFPQSGREPGSQPPYELYLNDASALPPEEWLTEICIPLAG